MGIPCRLVRSGLISFRTSLQFSWTSTNAYSVYSCVFHILIKYYELRCYIENSVGPDQLASEEAS